MAFPDKALMAKEVSFELTDIEFGPSVESLFNTDRLVYFEYETGEKIGPFRILERTTGVDPETGDSTLEIQFEKVDPEPTE